MRTKEELPECPVATAVSLIGGKWKLLLLRNLKERPWRFNELQRSIDGISQKVLTESLRQMIDDGLAYRRDYHENLYNKNRGRDLFRCGRCGKQRSSNPPAPHCPPQPVRPAAAKPLPPRAGPARLPRQLLPPCKRHVVLWSSSSCSNQGFCIKPACFSKYSGFCTLIQSLFLNKKTVHAPHTDCFMV